MSIDRKFLVKMVRESTEDVFSKMLDTELAPGEAFTAPNPTASSGDGVFAFVGLAGKWAGIGSVSLSGGLARRISSRFLMTESHGVDEEVLDSIAEITNMIIGNVKTKLEELSGPIGLSIPTVIYGRDFTSRTLGTQESTAVLFVLEGERMEVRICLAPQPGSVHSLARR